MVKLTVTYPSGDGTTFDHDYYKTSHIPMCNDAFKPSKTEVDKGLNGPNVAAVTFYFESMDALQNALNDDKRKAVMADIANYTNITPVTQISEVVG
jgi:uncharacterized protein (TIGR02118 family)